MSLTLFFLYFHFHNRPNIVAGRPLTANCVCPFVVVHLYTCPCCHLFWIVCLCYTKFVFVLCIFLHRNGIVQFIGVYNYGSNEIGIGIAANATHYNTTHYSFTRCMIYNQQRPTCEWDLKPKFALLQYSFGIVVATHHHHLLLPYLYSVSHNVQNNATVWNGVEWFHTLDSTWLRHILDSSVRCVCRLTPDFNYCHVKLV